MAFSFKTKQEFLELSYGERADYFRSAYDYFVGEYKKYKNNSDRYKALEYFKKYSECNRKNEYKEKGFTFNKQRYPTDSEGAQLGNAEKQFAENWVQAVNTFITECNKQESYVSPSFKEILYKLRFACNAFLDELTLQNAELVNCAFL